MSSPMKMTVEVVPSPLISSCATAVLAIIIAVGFWICCNHEQTKKRDQYSTTLFFESNKPIRRSITKLETDHFFQESVTVFGEFDVAGATNKPDSKRECVSERGKWNGKAKKRRRERRVHFDGAFGAEIGFEDILQALGGIDVHVKCGRFVQHFGVRVQNSQRHLSGEIWERNEHESAERWRNTQHEWRGRRRREAGFVVELARGFSFHYEERGVLCVLPFRRMLSYTPCRLHFTRSLFFCGLGPMLFWAYCNKTWRPNPESICCLRIFLAARGYLNHGESDTQLTYGFWLFLKVNSVH